MFEKQSSYILLISAKVKNFDYEPEILCNNFNDLESFGIIKYNSWGVFENCHKLRKIKITKKKTTSDSWGHILQPIF